jgi:hypothetical protein
MMLRCLAIPVALMALSGCATMLPAVGGRTHYEVEFTDTTTEQATTYRMRVKAPAGTELAGITGMTYDWADGNGQIAVSNEGSMESTAQAAMIQEVSRQQIEAFRAGLDAALNAIAPILGQHLNTRLREIETDAEVKHHAIDALEGR